VIWMRAVATATSGMTEVVEATDQAVGVAVAHGLCHNGMCAVDASDCDFDPESYVGTDHPDQQENIWMRAVATATSGMTEVVEATDQAVGVAVAQLAAV
jgi:hypothetical protein